MLAVRLFAGTGIVLGIVLGVCGLSALGRFQRAIWDNGRYRFTTWAWGKLLVMLLWISLCIQFAAVMH